MLKFEKEQKVAEIGNVKIGGQPGINPVVMIGTVFYSAHKALIDEKTGEIDEEMVERELNEFVNIAEECGIQYIVDVVGSDPDALIKECEFVADLVDCPFLVDGLNDDIRIPAMEGLKEIGLLDRAILNSIEESTSEDNLEKIKKIGVKNAVLLTFGTRYIYPNKKIELLKEKLIPSAQKAGIENYIVDTAVLDLPSISLNYETSRLVKEELGLPVGYAPSNAIYKWEFGKKFGKESRCGAIASIMTNAADAGSDFILFGPVKFAKCVIPAVSLISATKSYFHKRVTRNKISEVNPLKKVF
jgi:tetrahydromethanopterin S-methyltransferase subunit H